MMGFEQSDIDEDHVCTIDEHFNINKRYILRVKSIDILASINQSQMPQAYRNCTCSEKLSWILQV